MLDDLANRDIMVGEYETPDGRKINYRNFAEWGQFYALVNANADAEGATVGVGSRKVSAIPNSDTW